MFNKRTRRNFLTLSMMVAGGIVGCANFKTSSTARSVPQTTARSLPPTTTLPERILGKTGEKLPIFGLGGAGKTPLSWGGHESEAIALIERALELGIRYFDTAASYGPSEDHLGKVLPSYRQQIFLASKTAARDSRWRLAGVRAIADPPQYRFSRFVAIASRLVRSRTRQHFC